MLIFDELKKNDPQLRFVAAALAIGFCILLAGLWWVQIVSAREYRNHLETQSYRTVRIPAIRGKILDREGRVLADNRPRYNLNLYLGDLRKEFNASVNQSLARAHGKQRQEIAAQEKKLGRALTKNERKQFALLTEELTQLRTGARFRVADSIVSQIGGQLQQPLSLNATRFARDYDTRLALPLTILPDLDQIFVARYEENSFADSGTDLEIQSVRNYPLGTTASHLLGYVQRDESSVEGEDAYFSYRLPDYRGVVGIEGGYDSYLRGRAGAEAVLVNNLGYRQTENFWNQPEAGHNVVLTID
ncbi:MAG TPA: hypothetical protein VHG71_10385, partial [Verrucomicrobiae bacterium]|nr:hypothetical protein [Verrucomicrobiae bacterium]